MCVYDKAGAELSRLRDFGKTRLFKKQQAMTRDVEAADEHSKWDSCVRCAGVTTLLTIRWAIHPPSNLDFHGSSAASSADLTSVARFTGGLLSIATSHSCSSTH